MRVVFTVNPTERTNMSGPFANPHHNDPGAWRGADYYSGGVPAPGVPPGLGLGHGHWTPGQIARPPVTDFLGNIALKGQVSTPFPRPRW
jgi:hypothetical protein